MSTKHVRTTGDLVRFGCSLRIDCSNCFASKTINGAEAVAAFGLGSLRQAQVRLRCSRCGQKAARLLVLDPV
jgi:hypothetical protein